MTTYMHKGVWLTRDMNVTNYIVVCGILQGTLSTSLTVKWLVVRSNYISSLSIFGLRTSQNFLLNLCNLSLLPTVEFVQQFMNHELEH